jgi:predicted  nucleic acid-binding Zn-ribbon protein
MHADLERLIRLQQLEDLAERARRTIADEPIRQQELDAKLAAAQKILEDERQRLAANQVARRATEKELAEVQSRLSKFKDQMMAVKTNREYQAMQKELEVAAEEIRRLEDRLLERMIEHDEVTAHLKLVDAEFKESSAAIGEERTALAREVEHSHARLSEVAVEREALVPQIPARLVAIFDRVMRHHKLAAVAEVRDGRCSICNVRLRPQVYNDLHRNDSIIQCDSCHRILFYMTPAPPPPQP